jgi:hypothetical protein
VLWIDVKRAKQLWLREPELQLLRILLDYGIFPTNDTTDDLSFSVDLLARADRIWIACRPHATGCRDPVVLLRGDYNRYPLRKRLSHTNPGLDLGGGWLRYDRELNLGRSGLRRIYFAPPDRLLLVSTTELDAVERALERSRGSRDQVPKETGLVSLLVRPTGIARLLESRSSAAARWLRDARSLELQILPEPSTLKLVVTIGFESQQRAERASVAFRVLWSVLAPRRTSPIPIEVVGDSLVVTVELSAPSPGTVPAELDPAAAESSAQ